MRTWRDLGRAGQALVVGCLVLAAVVLAGVIRLLDGPDPPAAFEERPSLATCGQVDAGLSSNPEGPEVDCFEDALEAGRAAELVVGSLTDEGDETTTYYRSVPGQDGLELWHDATGDAFGSGRWEHYRCRGATGLEDFGDCREV
jgi:hypothetical protein